VKTPKGWRIKARTVITGQEQKANLTVEDVTVIRRLAGTDLDRSMTPGEEASEHRVWPACRQME
jgi:hypothetical protein